MRLKEMNIKEIMGFLPHRYPFLLVDRILEVVPGEKAVGLKNVTVNEPFFQGHFPGEPVMPGVLQIEALAQVGAVAVMTLPGFSDKLMLFAGIDNFRFRDVVRPGDQLIMEMVVSRIRGSVGKGEGRITVKDKTVASGELMFAITDK